MMLIAVVWCSLPTELFLAAGGVFCSLLGDSLIGTQQETRDSRKRGQFKTKGDSSLHKCVVVDYIA